MKSKKFQFHYELPNGGLHTCSYILPDKNIKFDPPVYEQRYTTAVRIIEDERWGIEFKKIADVGCAEMGLLSFLKRIPFVEHILEIDIDKNMLEYCQHRAVPLVTDYLRRRPKPLRIEVLYGDITVPDEHLYNVDVVIGLELIEHLTGDVLKKVPENVFNFIKPKLAIFSTPNAEFNVLFPTLLSNGFRHYDHKFEWTRKEFRLWAINICKKYGDYKVSFLGLGKPLKNHEHVGYATQMALFVRKDILNEKLTNRKERQQQDDEEEDDDDDNDDDDEKEEVKQAKMVEGEAQEEEATEEVEEGEAELCAAETYKSYKCIYVVDYPQKPEDKRTLEEKVIDETRYLINTLHCNQDFYNSERNVYQLPVNVLLDIITSKLEGVTRNLFFNILNKNDIEIENDFIIHDNYSDDCSDSASNDYDNDNLEKNVLIYEKDDDAEDCWD